MKTRCLALATVAFLASCGAPRVRGVDPKLIADAKRGAAALREDAAELKKASAAMKASGTADEKIMREADENLLKANDLDRRAKDVDDVKGKLVLLQGEYFFTIEPIIAVHDGLETTAIPSVGVNFRPNWDSLNWDWMKGSPLSLQLVFGGVLNPQNQDGEAAAIGAGLRQPIGEKGALSVGWIFWNDAGETEDGLYLGISLGDAPAPAPEE